MKKRIALCIFFVSLFSFSVSAFGSEKVIRVGIGNADPPICFSKGGESAGFEHDLWEAIGEKIGAKIEYKLGHFSILFGLLDNDEVDFAANYFAINPKRLERYNATEPYAYGFMKLLVLKSTNDVPHGLSDCSGKKVAVTATSNGRILIEEMNKEKKANIKIEVFEGDEGCIQAVEMGQAVGYFTGAGTSYRFIKDKYIDGKFVGGAEKITETAYFYSKNNAKVATLAKEVSQAIKELKAEGIIKKISLQWVGIDISDPASSDAL